MIWAESKLGRWSRFTLALPVFGEEGLYRFHLHRALDRARRSHETVSLIGVRLEGGLAAREEDGPSAMEEAFRLALATAEKMLFKSRDTLLPLPDQAEMRVLLPGTAKKDALVVLRRLSAGLEKAFEGREGLRPELAYGVSSYPEDGVSAPELENHLAEATGPFRVSGEGDLPADLDPFSLL